MTHSLPQHLRRYIVEQNYEKYTPVDQAVWRYILRQLRAFLSKHAHEAYLEGLQRTGIEIERIPRIEDISAKLEKFGWRALPVSGFIPPAAFMELQALGVLPIASDMRTLDHLLYTPAPDIVHEAAGHAPILIQPEFAQYLREYAQVAKKAIISKEDLALYEAIRDLSDLKENPRSTSQQIEAAQKKLDSIGENMSHVSEAAELSRMNWWTAEYGLIGDIKNPKLFGAGLLSSVGESKWCLSDKVVKKPLTVDCVEVGYDITEPQPQLFVTPDFATLTQVLHDLSQRMAYQTGGPAAVQKAIRAESVNTVQLDSGLQISGVCKKSYMGPGTEIAYLQFEGPTQLCFQDKEIAGHGKNYHSQGFGTPIGRLKNQKDLLTWTEKDFSPHVDKSITLEFASGVVVSGTLKKTHFLKSRPTLLSFENCKVTLGTQVLFDPSWGTFDLGVGTNVSSVFGGPADRISYGETEDFVSARVIPAQYSEKDMNRFQQYQNLRDLRENTGKSSEMDNRLRSLFDFHAKNFPDDWLFFLEIFEILTQSNSSSNLKDSVYTKLTDLSKNPQTQSVINDGLSLATSP